MNLTPTVQAAVLVALKVKVRYDPGPQTAPGVVLPGMMPVEEAITNCVVVVAIVRVAAPRKLVLPLVAGAAVEEVATERVNAAKPAPV